MIPYVVDRIEEGFEESHAPVSPRDRKAQHLNIELGMELLKQALDDQQLADTLDGHTVINIVSDDPVVSAHNLEFARSAVERGARVLTVHWKRMDSG